MYVSVCIEAILLVTNYVCIKIQIGFPILEFYRRVIVPILITGFVCTLCTRLSLYFTGPESFVRLIISSSISTVLLLTLLFMFALNKTEKTVLVNYIKNKINFYGRSGNI